MAGPKGLNVAEMQNLIATCRREASNIRGAISSVNGTVNSTWWQGEDADKFRNEWSYSDRRRLENVAAELDRLAGQLGREVAAQRSTSGF